MSGERFDLVVVGAGFAGLYLLHRARQLGFSARAFEAGSDVGGTWYWNRYPGARCDVESLEYSFGFDESLQQDWRWSERYAAQPEILRYAGHVADRFDLRRDIGFDTRVLGADWEDTTGRWSVRLSTGGACSAQFLVLATGCLSSANLPDIPGRETFAGDTFHTGRWPHHPVRFAGKRVGIIGTGSSAVQSIPILAQEAAELLVFQRTATYSVPARNGPLDPALEARVKADYAGLRARNRLMPNAFGSMTPRNEAAALAATPQARAAEFERRWQRGGLSFLGAFGDLMLDERANALAASFVRGKIHAVVPDPALATTLLPHQTIGCKRLCIDTGYYESFLRPNVRLLDAGEAPIEAITPTGVRAGGVEHPLDALVFATGFDAMTGSIDRIEVRGRGERLLKEAWRAGPRSYLGLCVAGFPNLFTVTGPGSPSVLTNMMASIEQHVEWITDCMAWLRAQGRGRIEAAEAAQDAWVRHVNAVADRTVYPSCNSWYLGANVPGKTRVFMPLIGFPAYVERCREVVARGYEGFVAA